MQGNKCVKNENKFKYNSYYVLQYFNVLKSKRLSILVEKNLRLK